MVVVRGDRGAESSPEEIVGVDKLKVQRKSAGKAHMELKRKTLPHVDLVSKESIRAEQRNEGRAILLVDFGVRAELSGKPDVRADADRKRLDRKGDVQVGLAA